MSVWSLVIAALVLSSAGPTAQTPQGQGVAAQGQRPAQPGIPPRDAQTPTAKGTGVIRGRVVAADTGRPLRRARITVSASELGSGASRSTSTDQLGRYEFRELAAARYRVAVTRSGYLGLDYGQRRPGEQGRPLQLAEAGLAERIDFALPRMSVVTGHVSDETGEPMEGVTVIAMRSLFFEGRRRLVPIATATTDDEGEYRLQKLAPASYVVMASTRETWTVVDPNGKETVFGYAPTYFPGILAGAEARRVSVGLGQQIPGIDLSLIPGRAAKISGIALDSQRKPFSRVSLSDDIRGVNFASFRGAGSATVAADGSFTITNVTPGEYRLSAARMAGEPGGEPELAETTVIVDGNDLENVVLTGSVGGTVSGRVVVDGGGTPPKWSSVLLTARQPLRNQSSPGLLGTFRNSGSARVKEDGTFVVEHVFDRARFQVTPPEGWMLKSVTRGGKDITDAELSLRSGEELDDVEVTITDRVTTISGQLIDDKNEPIHEATLIVFRADADKWFESSRAVRATRPDQQGQWRLRALPPGDYLAVALDYVEDGAWNDPEYLESLRRYGTPISLAEGASQTVAVKLTVPK
jgi:protocatechuate 3,4-dioxygenase beta subunit